MKRITSITAIEIEAKVGAAVQAEIARGVKASFIIAAVFATGDEILQELAK